MTHILLIHNFFRDQFHSAGGANPIPWTWVAGEPGTFYQFGPLRLVSVAVLESTMIMYIEMKYCKYHIVYIIISILTTVTGVVDRVQIGVLLGFAS